METYFSTTHSMRVKNFLIGTAGSLIAGAGLKVLCAPKLEVNPDYRTSVLLCASTAIVSGVYILGVSIGEMIFGDKE